MTRIARMVLASVVLTGIVAGVAQAHQPSFDCHKAKQWSDMMVCGNPNLADLDGQVDKAYKQASTSLPPKDAQQVREVQEAWLRGREKCQHDADPTKCLETYYQRRIKEIVQPDK